MKKNRLELLMLFIFGVSSNLSVYSMLVTTTRQDGMLNDPYCSVIDARSEEFFGSYGIKSPVNENVANLYSVKIAQFKKNDFSDLDDRVKKADEYLRYINQEYKKSDIYRFGANYYDDSSMGIMHKFKGHILLAYKIWRKLMSLKYPGPLYDTVWNIVKKGIMPDRALVTDLSDEVIRTKYNINIQGTDGHTLLCRIFFLIINTWDDKSMPDWEKLHIINEFRRGGAVLNKQDMTAIGQKIKKLHALTDNDIRNTPLIQLKNLATLDIFLYKVGFDIEQIIDFNKVVNFSHILRVLESNLHESDRDARFSRVTGGVNTFPFMERDINMIMQSSPNQIEVMIQENRFSFMGDINIIMQKLLQCKKIEKNGLHLKVFLDEKELNVTYFGRKRLLFALGLEQFPAEKNPIIYKKGSNRALDEIYDDLVASVAKEIIRLKKLCQELLESAFFIKYSFHGKIGFRKDYDYRILQWYEKTDVDVL